MRDFLTKMLKIIGVIAVAIIGSDMIEQLLKGVDYSLNAKGAEILALAIVALLYEALGNKLSSS